MKKFQTVVEYLMLLAIITMVVILIVNRIKQSMGDTLETMGEVVGESSQGIDTGLNEFYGKYAPLGREESDPLF